MVTVTRARFRVTGTVQGVGFRPFVYRHAIALALDGFVCNDSAGVLIEVEGWPERISELARLLADDAPPLARVSAVCQEALTARGEGGGFSIVTSFDSGAPDVPVSVDTATCSDCLAEVDDSCDRRYRYPFTNCTNCGPRYTIVRSVPYDRPTTTMASFPMCRACRAEYDDPADRRFHAQPNACPECGPRLSWRTRTVAAGASGDAALLAVVAALRSGNVVGIKGIGGYHLAVDATDARAVGKLRRRKARDDKPFAVMVADLDAARGLCTLSHAAELALSSPRRPIVLAPRRPGGAVAAGVAPGLPELGLMLPYSPLHHLLLAGVDGPFVMTSGNLSDEPIAHDDDEAVSRLGPLVDGLLTHDRAIHIRCDDSVARATGDRRVQILRRSRGYAPEPFALPSVAKRSVLAVGAEMKSTIAVARDGFVVASHHIGDLEHLPNYRSFLQAVDHLRLLYGVTPEVVAHDLHPEYLSTKFALELDLPAIAVQHHHAHVAACLVEYGRTAPVLALAFDGLGYGPDGTLWGGEFLVADLEHYDRVGHLLPIVMPGGVAAIREPWRMATAWAAAAGCEAEVIADFEPRFSGLAPPEVDDRVRAVAGLVAAGHGPITTSMGRLFDAVAVVLGGRIRVSYEAQAAIELEAMARTVARADAPSYPRTVVVTDDGGGPVLDPTALVAAIVSDRRRGVPAALLAAGFHEAIGSAAATLALSIATARDLDAVALTGGVFQNARLSEIVENYLHAAGVTVLVAEAIPPNDGGISIGQAAIATRA